MLRSFQKVTYQPSEDSWHLPSKRLNLSRFLSDSERDELRAEIFSAAATFTKLLDKHGAVLGTSPSLPYEAKRAYYVMTGHQPIIYHGGLTYKDIALERFSAEKGATGINVIIDTDEGSGGEIYYPGEGSIARGNFGGSGLYSSQRVLPVSELEKTFADIKAALQKLSFTKEAQNAAEVESWYLTLAGEPIVLANSLVRREVERRILGKPVKYFDLPFSKILKLPVIRKLWKKLFSDYDQLHLIYNQCLHEFRAKRRIRSKANPFRDLASETDSSFKEMPFWLISYVDNKRAPLWLCELDGKIMARTPSGIQSLEEIYDQWLIAPKAAFITLLLRMFCSDFFIHGMGGAKYDAFTDLFIEGYFGLTPPPYGCTSASLYLFEKEALKWQREMIEPSQLRHIRFHSEKFLDHKLFNAEQTRELRELGGVRNELTHQLRKIVAQGESAAAVTKEIKVVDRQIEAVVHRAAANKLGRVSREDLQLYFFREFPTFYFI